MQVKGFKNNGGLCPICGTNALFPIYKESARDFLCRPTWRKLDLRIDGYVCHACDFRPDAQPFCFFMNVDGTENTELKERFNNGGVHPELVY